MFLRKYFFRCATPEFSSSHFLVVLLRCLLTTDDAINHHHETDLYYHQWMVLEARKMVDQGDNGSSLTTETIQALNGLGYDEAAEHVYGVHYDDWKSRHQKKASDDQLALFQATASLQAQHDKTLLAKRNTNQIPAKQQTALASSVPLSNVCCQDTNSTVEKGGRNQEPPFQVPPPLSDNLPTNLPEFVHVGVLTVSDRASNNQYDTGDLSGPAVVRAVRSILPTAITTLKIVPDEVDAIQNQIRTWSSDGDIHIILTTGGTGFSRRDVTPEATRAILEQECTGLIPYCVAECSRFQPLAALTRGTAGFLEHTMIANLPGNPKAVDEVIPIVFPILLHAMVELLEVSN